MNKKTIIMTMLLLCNIVKAECYIMGDSIAQGVAINRRDCSSETQVGLNTKKAMQFWSNKGVIKKDKVIISLGINDGNIDTIKNLIKIRDNMKANEVIWILPPNKEKSKIVNNIASNYGDYVLNINSEIGKDNIHPTGKGYIKIAEYTKAFQQENKNRQKNETISSSAYQYRNDYVQN